MNAVDVVYLAPLTSNDLFLFKWILNDTITVFQSSFSKLFGKFSKFFNISRWNLNSLFLLLEMYLNNVKFKKETPRTKPY